MISLKKENLHGRCISLCFMKDVLAHVQTGHQFSSKVAHSALAGQSIGKSGQSAPAMTHVFRLTRDLFSAFSVSHITMDVLHIYECYELLQLLGS